MYKYDAQARAQRADDVVWAIISQLEPGRIEAPDAAWHEGFAHLRDEFGSKLPGLKRLEFHRSDDVPPVSDELDEILQLMTASTLNPRLNVVELTEKHQSENLRHVDMSKLDGGAVREAARKLRQYLKPPDEEPRPAPAKRT